MSDIELLPKTPCREVKSSLTSLSLTSSSFKQGTKCKTMVDQLAEVAENEQVNCIKIANINVKAKTQCSFMHEKIHHQLKLELKVTCLKHQAQEVVAART